MTTNKFMIVFLSVVFVVIMFGLHVWLAIDFKGQREVLSTPFEGDQVYRSGTVGINPETPCRLLVRIVVSLPEHTEKVFPDGYVLPFSYAILNQQGKELYSKRLEMKKGDGLVKSTKKLDSRTLVSAEHYFDRLKVESDSIRVRCEAGELKPKDAKLEKIGIGIVDNTKRRLGRMIGISVCGLLLWSMWVGRLLCKRKSSDVEE